MTDTQKNQPELPAELRAALAEFLATLSPPDASKRYAAVITDGQGRDWTMMCYPPREASSGSVISADPPPNPWPSDPTAFWDPITRQWFRIKPGQGRQ